MAKIIFVSGPCGCGKSTFVNAYARHLVNENKKTVYVIHGDDFHAGFVEVEDNDDLQGLIREYRALRLMRPDSDTPRGYAISVHNSSTARIDKAIIGLLYAFFYILRASDHIFF